MSTSYAATMNSNGLARHPVPSEPSRMETEAERTSRISREEDMIMKAEIDIQSGRGIDERDLEGWLDSLDGDANAPLPPAKSRPTGH